jgi:hypothetical protein
MYFRATILVVAPRIQELIRPSLPPSFNSTWSPFPHDSADAHENIGHGVKRAVFRSHLQLRVSIIPSGPAELSRHRR